MTYIVVAQEDEYYSSCVLVGVWSTLKEAQDNVDFCFEAEQKENNRSFLHQKDLSNESTSMHSFFTGKRKRDNSLWDNDWNIAILEKVC